jgi:hypothetical protein
MGSKVLASKVLALSLCACAYVYMHWCISTHARASVCANTPHTHTHTHTQHEKKYNEMRNILKIYKLHTKKDHVGSDEILDEFRV